MTDSPPPSGTRWTTVVDGRRLRQLRRQHHLSQKQLAQQAGINQATVTRLEDQPRASCCCRTLARLASVLDQAPASLTPTGHT